MKTLFETAFRGRRVLITGHTGFKGSWLAIWLHRLGARVSGYSLAPPTDPSNYGVSKVGSLLEHEYIADVRDTARLDAAVSEVAPEFVFHLAAQALVRYGYEHPRETFDVNVMGTVNVFEAVRASGRPCVVVVVTSDKCYENREHVWGYREIDPMGGYDPYSASKGCAELVVASMRRSYFPSARVSEHGVKVASGRAGNVIGGGDWAQDRIMADLMRALHAGRPLEVRSPSAVRPWQHVLDPLSGYLTLAARMAASDDPRWQDGWNFGPLTGSDVPVRDLVDMAIAAYGSGSWIDASDPTAPHEAHLLRLNIDKAVWDLGWHPRWDAPRAVTHLARWFRAWHEGADMHAQCERDIADFESS